MTDKNRKPPKPEPDTADDHRESHKNRPLSLAQMTFDEAVELLSNTKPKQHSQTRKPEKSDGWRPSATPTGDSPLK